MNIDREELLKRFSAALSTLDHLYAANPRRLDDENTDTQLREWLDAQSTPLEWAGAEVTADEWFFITTLYGTMTRDGQRTHIRKFFPMFVTLASRDIRNLNSASLNDWKLRAPWMKSRLIRMGEVLRERGITMAEYAESLRDLERTATPENPSPALKAIGRDLLASELKTLSVFVRDCIHGNCFPIDSRVANELRRHGLPSSPSDELLLVGLSLSLGRNPRQVARMFYESGGEGAVFG